jgi:DnaJ family protein C protein 13
VGFFLQYHVLFLGGVLCLVSIFSCSNDQEVREKAAEVLSKMTTDKLMGPKVRIALSKFLPDIFLDAIKKSPVTGVQMFESTHENPELIWNDKARAHMTKVVRKLAAE